MSLLSVQNLGISFGGIRAVDGVSFSMVPGQVFSIIGPNGAGKTTLFNLISGIYRTESGSVRLKGEDVTRLEPEALTRRGMARTFQNLQVFFRMSALENVMVGAHIHEGKHGFSHLLGLPRTGRENARTREVAMALLKRLHLAEVAERMAGALSYGQLKRLEIARALAARPQLLLLDEPAAGCNPKETAEIDEIIMEVAKSGVGILLVEHDMKLVMGVSDRVLVLAQGRPLAEGLPTEVVHNQRVIEAYLGAGLPVAEPTHA